MVQDGVHDFVEDLALWFEQSGVPRIAGRLLGWLLVCDPPEQSAEQLAEALRVSRGSVSTNTRLLTTTGLVERTTIRGDRRTYYRARSDWSALLDAQYARTVELRQLVEKGIGLLDGAEPARRERLSGVHRFASFWEKTLAELLEHRPRPTGGPS